MEYPSLSREGGEGRIPYTRRATPHMATVRRPKVEGDRTIAVSPVKHTPDWKLTVVGMAMASSVETNPEGLVDKPSLVERARAYLSPTLGDTEELSARDVIDLYRERTGYTLSGEELKEYLLASVIETEGAQQAVEPMVSLDQSGTPEVA